jgi:hypothetical protein
MLYENKLTLFELGQGDCVKLTRRLCGGSEKNAIYLPVQAVNAARLDPLPLPVDWCNQKSCKSGEL